MNKIIPYQDKAITINVSALLDPHTERANRVNSWLAILEKQAKSLIANEYQDGTFEECPWLALTEDELNLEDPSQFDESKRIWYYRYHTLVLDKITELAGMVCEDAQGTVARIVQEKKRKMLLWATIENIDQATEEIAKQIDLDLSRADHRQMQALLKRQDELEQAGVDPDTLLEVFARKPKFAIVAGALVGNIADDENLSQEEKNTQIKDVMEQAATVQTSTQIKSNHRGISAQYETTKLNGSTVLHILCANTNDFTTVFGKLADILVACDEPLPIIYQTQQKKGYDDALKELAIAFAIIQSGESDLSTVDKSIVDILKHYERIE